MCGITGLIDFKHRTSKEELVNMTNRISHRGPDSSGIEWINTEAAQIGLGHRRLSILDLSEAGHQPMCKHNHWITYNGEIYNFKSIKEKLKKKGYAFSSSGDTEVLLSAYQEWGFDCLAEFEGMFAFALYDPSKQLIFIGRDRAGMKPLYYYHHNNLFLFASELKAFHDVNAFTKEISHTGVSEYFINGYIPTPHTIFKNTFKLNQGQYGILNLQTKDFKCDPYWTVNNKSLQKAESFSNEELIEHTETLLVNSCMSHMIADVPVGVFLSGGYDSSTVAAIIQKHGNTQVKTFTIGFDDAKYNEAPHAKRVAEYLDTSHTELTCILEDAKEIIPQLADIFDEPFSDYSAIPTYLLSQLTKEHVKVSLSADGGDELFVGYRRFTNSIKLAHSIQKIPKPITSLSGKLLSYITKETFSENYIKRKLNKILIAGEISSIPIYQNQKLLSEDLSKLLIHTELTKQQHHHTHGDLNDIFRIEYQQYLQDEILVKVDRASMAVGLEAREPLLDHHIVEWAINLPLSIKYNNGKLKHILKSIAHKYVPKHLLDRPKQGFNIPIMTWVREDMNWLISDLLNSHKIEQQGIFNTNTIDHILLEFKRGEQTFYDKIVWQLIVFQLWYQKWMN